MNTKSEAFNKLSFAMCLALAASQPLLVGDASAQSLNRADEREHKATNADIEDSQSSLRQAVNLARTQGLQIVYHGSQQLAAQLGSEKPESALQLDSNKQIIITDSLDKHLAMELMARGNFVVMVGRNDSNPAKSAMSMLYDLAETGSLQKARAAYDVEQARMSVTTDDGRWVEENVSAYFYSPSGSGSFHTVEQDTVAGVAKAIQWVRDEVMTSGFPAERKFAKNWSSAPAYTRTDDVTCNSGNVKAGNVYYRTAYTKLSEANSTYDYWTVKYVMQMVPNYSNTTYRWRNDFSIIRGDADSNKPGWKLLDYSPTNSASGSTISVGLDSAGVASISWSYTLSDVSIVDGGSLGNQLAKWTHNINENSTSGTNSTKMEPGAMIRVNNGATNVWNSFLEVHTAAFISLTGGLDLVEKKACEKRWNG